MKRNTKGACARTGLIARSAPLGSTTLQRSPPRVVCEKHLCQIECQIHMAGRAEIISARHEPIDESSINIICAFDHRDTSDCVCRNCPYVGAKYVFSGEYQKRTQQPYYYDTPIHPNTPHLRKNLTKTCIFHSFLPLPGRAAPRVQQEIPVRLHGRPPDSVPEPQKGRNVHHARRQAPNIYPRRKR